MPATKASNVPAELEDKFKSCKEQVMAEDGMTEESAYAICYTSVVEGKSLEDAKAEHTAKAIKFPATRKLSARKDDYMYMPPTSLEALRAEREAHTQAVEIGRAVDDFQSVVYAIAQSPDIPDKGAAIAEQAGFLQQMIADIAAGVKSLAAKWGARHSKTDNDAIQSVHDMSVQLGAMCAGKAKSAFGVCKGRDGQYYGLGVFTNCYEDLDGEIITDAAHKEFAAYLDANPSQAPELWTWHEPGTARKSRANWWDYDGTFFWMQWPLTQDEATRLASVKELSMSHQFNGTKSGNNWTQYRTFEASVLTQGAEANPFTSFETVQKELSMFTPEKRAAMIALHGEEFTKEREQASDKARKEADALGTARKETKDKEAQAQADVIPTAPIPTDALIVLTESVKALSVQLQSLDARMSALTQSKEKEVAAQVETQVETRMSWMTSPRAPTSGIADAAKERGTQLSAEEATKAHVTPLENWLKPTVTG